MVRSETGGARMITTWEKQKVVDHMQGVIEAHLGEPLTLAALTRGTGYSMWHAARMFQEITGETPLAYLRRRRLSEAALRLVGGGHRVADVAFDFTFDSHEGFTRAFAREFGLTPVGFMKNRPALPLFLPPRARAHFSKRQQGEIFMKKDRKTEDKTASTATRTVFVQIVERPARRLVLLRGRAATHYFEYCEEVGCEVWDRLAGIPDALHEPMGLWLPENLRPEGTSTYVQGVEVAADWAGEVPEGFEVIDLGPCRWLVFQGEPFDDRDFERAIEDLWDVMNRYDPSVIGYRWADADAPRFQLAPLGERGYIEGRPVDRI